MVRAQDLKRATPPLFGHNIFRTENGDSFRLVPLAKYPGECLTLVYRYRFWENENRAYNPAAEEIDA